MARPRTKGELIQFRLPIDVHEALIGKAEVHKETPSEFCARYIERAIRIQVMAEKED